MIVEKQSVIQHRSLDDTQIWTDTGKLMNGRVTRTRIMNLGASRQEIEDWIEKDDRFTGEYVITPSYIFFETEEEALFFKLIYNGY